MITKGQIIYIALSPASLLECYVEKITADNKIHFEVVNGSWTGYFDPDQSIIYVKET